MLIHGRNGALALVVTALALIAPATASAGHDLVIYKAEKHVTLVADEKSETVSCDSGDHALDGMWRIDHADQDEYVAPLDLIKGAVDVLQAAPTSDDTYTFSFVKNAIGNVQLKIWVTCLKDQTQGGSHNHDFSTAFSAYSTSSVPASPFSVGPGATVSATGSCTGKTVLVSPGFTTTIPAGGNTNNNPPDSDPEPGMNRLLESNYTSPSMKTWQWTFRNPAGITSNVTVTWRCLNIKVPQTPGTDKHKLVAKHRTLTANLPAQKVTEVRLDCKDMYKAAVAGFTIAPADWDYVWYLGMDPRPKQRAFRFVNSDALVHPVTVKALCINYRTT
jgi:hypothetical protein